ncbi:MAG: tRNA (adenosine(37)-N6)-threonylcarbamoyltransferase complex dimerization subunit type 1 TsaB [Candidatus Saccharimonadales bacterium]
MILLLDTSTPVCKLTLINGDLRHEYEWQADRTLAKFLLAYLRDRLAEHAATLHGVTAIGAFEGPGSFTGLRIGLTVLNTIADAQAIPIVGARGDDWQNLALQRLSNGENDQLVMPHYGSDAHITAPRK